MQQHKQVADGTTEQQLRVGPVVHWDPSCWPVFLQLVLPFFGGHEQHALRGATEALAIFLTLLSVRYIAMLQITRTADGYQPHLVSPERGLQLMASKALNQVEGPVQECVSQVYTLLIAAARDAATVAGEHTEAAMNGKVPLNVPEFKTFIMPAVVRALDEWRAEAEKSKWQSWQLASQPKCCNRFSFLPGQSACSRL